MTDRIGQQVGQYRLVRLLGEGGFAEVYLGEHLHLGTHAAIKMLSAKLSVEEIERFREEARTIARLKHPSIVRVLDFVVEGHVPYLVMDYAPQGTLRQRHPKGTRLPPAQLVPYMRQVGSALQYAHDHHLIHRDIKPENMLVGEQGEVLLSDFGIALVAQSSRNPHTHKIPPERWPTWPLSRFKGIHARPATSMRWALCSTNGWRAIARSAARFRRCWPSIFPFSLRHCSRSGPICRQGWSRWC